MTSNVVLFGCPRSGTSLFLELFETLGWGTYFEPGMDFVTNSLKKEAKNRDKPWALKNPIDTAGYRDAGLACQLVDLHDAIGTDYVGFWIIRHPLDTICSLRPGLEKWQHQPIPPGYLKLANTRFADERGVAMWKWVNLEGRQTVCRGVEPTPMVLRYEDLLSEPRMMIKQIELATKGNFTPTHVDTFLRRISRQPGVHEAAHQVRWSAKTHSAHTGRWREDMNIHQVTYAVAELGVVPGRFGYHLPTLSY